MDDKFRKWVDIRLQENENTNEAGESDAVPENVSEDVPFMTIPLRSGTGDHDALRVDHFAHDAPGAVGRSHQDWI